MAGEKTKFALTEFFNNLFKNFGKLILTNIIFALPFAVFFALFYFINYITGINANFILFLTIIPLFPFFAGVTLVTAKMVRKEENIDVFNTFVTGVKDNFLRFLLHGAVLYFAVFFSYYSISMYGSWISQINNSESSGGAMLVFLYVFLIISILIAVAFLFIFFYLPPMTVTFDLSLKNIYKNCALMSFGEFKHNIIATFGIFVFALLCATILLCAGSFNSSVVLIITTAVIILLFVPSIVSFIINSAVYSGMYSMITAKDKKVENLDKKIERRKQGDFFDYEDEDKPDLREEFLNLDIDESKDGDEYIFYNGKMVKRSVILKLKQEKNKESGEK